LNAFFGYKVYVADRHSKANRTFALFALVTAVWVVCDFSLYQQNLALFQTALNKLTLSVICLLVISLAWFVTFFPEEILKVPKFVSGIVVAVTTLMVLAILFTNSIAGEAFMEDYGSNFTQGKLFYLFAVFASIFTIYSCIMLIVKYIKFQGDKRIQIKYMFYGIVLLTALNLIFNLFIPMVTKSFEYARFGTYSSLFFVAFTAYAILKVHAFNLRIILTESTVVAINVVLIVQVFTSRSLAELGLRLLLICLVLYSSNLLVRSVKREIEQKEELELISEELTRANEKLQAIDAMKTEFVSMASHELLTPISAIEGYLSMILDEKMAKVDDPKAKEYMDRVYQSAKRLARLVADLLNVSRIEEGRLLVEKQDVELEELITSVVNELKFKAEGAKIVLSSEMPDETKVKLYVDPDKIKEVVVNLCGNSIKYNHESGFVKVKTMILPTEEVLKRFDAMGHVCKTQSNADQPDDGSIQTAVNEKYKTIVGDKQVVVAVEDNGIGIEPCDIGQLFKKFSRVGDWSTQEVQGTGLGLYISRSLVEMHHGRIWVESQGKDKGSTFYFSMPVYEAKDQVVKLDAEVPKAKDAKPLAKSAAEGAENKT
jgi:signal transduction histidine kinase